MPNSTADRNLLFGILALQMDLITRDALIMAMNAWILDKGKPLGQILCEQGALASDDRVWLDAGVARHIALHDNDAEKSLAALSSLGSVRKELGEIADADVQASMHVVASNVAGDDDPNATASVGMITSGGTRFRILRPHKKGGLGEVYVAHDEELHREVALKEIQGRHAANQASRARFLLEAEITGGLEHPGIVPVYGLGQYADGRPYYAMRFIRGDSLQDAIKRYHQDPPGVAAAADRVLELRQLLGRFVDVCQALQYAHDRGVLHRDLKPGNIMLGKYGETLIVDWGLAKATGKFGAAGTSTAADEPTLHPAGASGSVETLQGSTLGTPQYMSPEQAAGRLDQLGPASDVYSLGATLFTLLTGKAPVDAVDVAATIRKVQQGDILRPRAVAPEVDPPLEAICLKAMRLKPADRYATPRALADDIERWLADSPVRAWPESWPARAKRWMRHHQTFVTSSAASLCIGLIAVTAGVVWYQQEQNRQASEASQRRADADHKRSLAEAGIRNALDQANKSRTELHAILTQPGGVFALLNESARWHGLIQNAQASLRGAQHLLATAGDGLDHELSAQTARLEELLRQDETDRLIAEQLEKIRMDRTIILNNRLDNQTARVQYPLAFTRAESGILQAPPAEVAARLAASPIKEQLLAALDDWAYVAHVTAQEALLKRILEIGRLAAPDPTWGDRLRQFENFRNRQAMTDLLKTAPARLSPSLIALIAAMMDHNDPGRTPWLRQAQTRYPADFWLNLVLGTALEKSDPREAAGFFHAAIAVRPNAVVAYFNLSVALREQKKWSEAIAAIQKAIELQPNYALARVNLGAILLRQNKLAEAAESIQKAIEMDARLPIAHFMLGHVLHDQKKVEEAAAAYRKAIELDRNYFNAYTSLAVVLAEQQMLVEAVAACEKAIELSPRDAVARRNLGDFLRRQQKLPEAVLAYQKALQLDLTSVAAYINLGMVLREQKKLEEAAAAFSKAIELEPKNAGNYVYLFRALRDLKKLPEAAAVCQQAIDRDPKDAIAHFNLGIVLHDLKKLPDAAAAYQRYIDLNPKSPSGYVSLGHVLGDQKKLIEAATAYRRAMELDPKNTAAYRGLGIVLGKQQMLAEASAAFQKVIDLGSNNAESYYDLGTALHLQKRQHEAIAAFQKVIALKPSHAEAHCNLGLALQATGDFAGALKALQTGHDLGNQTSHWRYPSAAWIKKCNDLVALDRRTAPVLEGKAKATASELLQMASMCAEYQKRYATATSLYRQAFQAQPGLLADVDQEHRYNAACAAAQAGTFGDAAKPLTGADKDLLRQQARDWLVADFDAYAKLAEEGRAMSIVLVEERLAHWKADADLAGVRDAKRLPDLSPAEQAVWQRLWADVDQLHQQARAAITDTAITGTLTETQNQRVHEHKMLAGTTYIIEMKSTDFDSYLKLHDQAGKLIAKNDDISATNLDSRITFTPSQDAVFRITATSFEERGRGAYLLSIRAIAAKK